MLELKTVRVWFGATLLVGAISCGYTLSAQNKQSAAEVAGCAYSIGIGDQLEVSVWRHPELSKTVVVDRNGNISLPLVNAVKTSGLSVDGLAHILTRELKRVFPEPFVTVIVSRISRTNSLPACTSPLSPELRWDCCIALKR